MHAADRGVYIQPGGVLPEPRNDARRPDEGDVSVEAESASPSRKLRHRMKPAVADDPDLAVAAVVHPHFATMQACRVGSGQAVDDRLAGRARENDPAPVHRELEVSRPPPCQPGRRCGEIRSGQVVPRRDRVELEVVPTEDRAVLGLDALRPPDALARPSSSSRTTAFSPTALACRSPADHRQVVEIEAAREESRADRDQLFLGLRSPGCPGAASIQRPGSGRRPGWGSASRRRGRPSACDRRQAPRDGEATCTRTRPPPQSAASP